MGSTYTIFYGWLSDGAHGRPNTVARRIAAARVPLLVAAYWTDPRTHCNLSDQVLGLMHDAGTQVYGYVSTRWGGVELETVRACASECVDSNVDGVFLDEGHNCLDASKLPYYRAVAQVVRDRGKALIVNPGVSRCGEDIMSVADLVMVEHQWRDLREHSPWVAGYEGSRFMGVSSNEERGMGYFVDGPRAIADTREAWDAGIGWHTSTDRYTRLPFWFEEYVAAVRA